MGKRDKSKICKTCDFWKQFHKDKGQCRVKSPQVIAHKKGGPVSAWPKTDADDWCGEHSDEEDRKST